MTLRRPVLAGLAPHDADLVEADAAGLYADNAPAGLDFTPWDACPEFVREVFRAMVANPYQTGQLER